MVGSVQQRNLLVAALAKWYFLREMFGGGRGEVFQFSRIIGDLPIMFLHFLAVLSIPN